MSGENYQVLIETLVEKIKHLEYKLKEQEQENREIRTENVRLNQVIRDLESRK